MNLVGTRNEANRAARRGSETSLNDTTSADLLHFGYHVRAVREG